MNSGDVLHREDDRRRRSNLKLLSVNMRFERKLYWVPQTVNHV